MVYQFIPFAFFSWITSSSNPITYIAILQRKNNYKHLLKYFTYVIQHLKGQSVNSMKQNIKNKTRIHTKVYSQHDKTGFEMNSHEGSDELFIWDQLMA